MVMILLFCGVAFWIVAAAIRIVIGWVHAPAGARIDRAVRALMGGFLKAVVVIAGAAILAAVAFAATR